MDTRDIFAKAVKRAKVNGVEEFDRYGVIVFLENEIDMYRDKIKYLENRLYNKDIKINEIITTLDAVQENGAAEIIKALSENGYNTITINCYKDNESEEN